MNLFVYANNNPICYIDPLGLEFSDIFPGIQTAITEGFNGVVYSIGQASSDIYDLSQNGDPYVKTALGVATVTVTAPVLGAVGVVSWAYVGPPIYNIAPYSPIMYEFADGFLMPGMPPQSTPGYYGWASRRFLFDPFTEWLEYQLSKENPKENSCP
ncbi:MAG: hypothetical protein A2277_03925 [Desulfobacterales bacterium RIFOXYA12_FULL_46_15]|nr:MAG: hypothetical protein A2277_03925 [Desulfobacterales bacterium RIFOXYA12_FULL_46_15]